jgi:mRNA degradation ribonuclease J1/J2
VTDARPSADDVVAAAGWTRIAATDTYLIVANVLPGEQMFTAAEAQEQHPIEGELIISGNGRALGVDSRHVEAHVYDRSTGLPLANLKPHIVLLNRTTGKQIEVESTLMQDVNIGAIDIHYGNNVTVVGNSDLRLTVTIGDEEATLDGHLD